MGRRRGPVTKKEPGTATEEDLAGIQMQNSTHSPPLVFRLTFGTISDINYVYGVISLVGFLMIILSNFTVVSTVYLNQSLHQPMYVFISALCTNGLYGSTSLFPSLIVNLFHKTQIISYAACIMQIFCIYSYVSCEMSILTAMAYDRYVCICNPLRYATIMTLTKAFKIIIGVLLYSFIIILVHIILTMRLPLCDNVILKIICDNWSLVRLSCIDTTLNNVYGLFFIVTILGVMPLLVALSYVQILKVCTKSKDNQSKALQACSLQLISLAIFVIDCLFEVLLYRLGPTQVPYGLRVAMSIQSLVVPPFVNPLLYGIKMKAIKVKILQFFTLKKT
ncbi:PREDICTED: olfactory receptor 51L1-like [Nanorana parkeri]|uniref:olfactory receptor 51L1-like n=1 Tax=Nanorana parkeri TaxID=125878 RepID=UPI00085433C3|nr:PREDICTED: olfactory receptor 51L1-like [Nanorana parkeri]